MEVYTKTGRALAALVAAARTSPEGVPLADALDWYPGDAPGATKFRKAVGKLVAADLAAWTDATETAAVPTDRGRTAVIGNPLGRKWDDAPADGAPAPRYKHLKEIPKDRLEADLNKAAAGGWRVVDMAGYYHPAGGGDVYYWVLLERADAP